MRRRLDRAQEFALNLLRLRLERGITQGDLARHCRVTQSQISRWERARSAPDAHELARLAAILGVEVVRFYVPVTVEDGFSILWRGFGGIECQRQ